MFVHVTNYSLFGIDVLTMRTLFWLYKRNSASTVTVKSRYTYNVKTIYAISAIILKLVEGYFDKASLAPEVQSNKFCEILLFTFTCTYLA